MNPRCVVITSASVALLSGMFVGCGSRATPVNPGFDLAKARDRFTTKLHSRGPAPQAYEDATPPSGVREVAFRSGPLKLKAWLSDDPGDRKKRPAVVYLHGGWAFAPPDWRDAAPFVKADFVLMMPMLRAENGNPGHYEGFYREVDDAIAAGEFMATLPYVDADNIFLAGHSVGAVLATLAAMKTSRYKAAAGLSGYLDMQSWVKFSDPQEVIFDAANPEEVRLRNPMAFVASLKIPLILFAERGGMDEVNAQFETRAKRAGKSCELFVVSGDHQSMVKPSINQSIDWFRTQAD